MTKYLVVFDVDSTLIEDEVIELLAEVAGKREEVAAVTERAMAGELDFAQSLIERVATLAGLPESVFADVQSRIRITTGAEETIAAIQAAGGKVGAVSGGFIQLLTPLAAELNLDFARANELEVVDGKLTGKVIGMIIDRSAKAEALREWSIASGLTNTVAVGDGANDLEMMALADLGVAFNAKPIVREKADVVIEGKDLRKLLELLTF
ncbi:phosphoserine phosphatase SerB [Rhodoluna lacicola]|uniref:phosphoserine phosphatase n=1 Tax=Rhodoluna lacicola TaxID=529884 RepID=A0A060JFV5_9MICO|nr:phosphoserine phosphatase SerB [Rhodoluna lacicola]AIC47605.1 phosphoserine phosphatase SerB [Rhodoluna lacicola]